jgi:hypothetical protein
VFVGVLISTLSLSHSLVIVPIVVYDHWSKLADITIGLSALHQLTVTYIHIIFFFLVLSPQSSVFNIMYQVPSIELLSVYFANFSTQPSVIDKYTVLFDGHWNQYILFILPVPLGFILKSS